MNENNQEQPLERIGAASESTAADATADSNQEGAAGGQPSAKKWANLFDSPEKLEEAYGHIYRAFHSKGQELQQTRTALDNLVKSLLTGGQAQSAPAAGLPFQGVAPGAPGPEILQAIAETQQAAQAARDMGEKFLLGTVENQVSDFFRNHADLGAGESDFERFAEEVSGLLGALDASAIQKLPSALERAYRILTYPEAVRAAREKQEQEERYAGRFVVESAGAGTMSMPRNQAAETSFRRLVQRLKKEAGV